ncbi:hypothetical protein SAMN06296386_10518 [Lachnospiraceae bacterium]|nr:hypothetical protein SAMN06296386_10518 [Lachnospiraceae bacterium]
MKRIRKTGNSRVAAVITAAILSFAVVGCGSSAKEPEAVPSAEAPAEAGSEAPSAPDAPSEMPTDAAPSDSEAVSSESEAGSEVRAIVSSVDGEKLTLEAFPAMGGAPNGEKPSGEAPGGEKPSGEAPSGEKPSGEAPSGEKPSGEAPKGETLELTLTSTTEYKDCTTDDIEEGKMVVVTYDENKEVVSIAIESAPGPAGKEEQPESKE